MSKQLQDMAVLITGANRGIGEQIAYAVAREGATILLTYAHDEEAAKKVSEKCLALGASKTYELELHLNDSESIRTCVAQIKDASESIDVLINNAGVMSLKKLQDLSEDEVDYQINVNLRGLITLTRMLIPDISHTIINISSMLGKVGKGGSSVYSATKFAVRGFTQSLAKELSIPVYCINPGVTATRMGGFSGMKPEIVGEVSCDLILRKYNVKSGADIDMRDCIRGPKKYHVIRLLRRIKNMSSYLKS